MNADPANVSRFMSHARSDGSAPCNRDLLRTFSAISKALNLDQPLNLTLNLIAEKVSQTMGHKYCAVYLHEKETGELLLGGSYGLSKEYIEAVNTSLVQKVDGNDARANSASITAFKTQTPIHTKDITLDPRFEPWIELALKTGYKSVVSLPLIFRCEPIGVLNCYDDPRTYSEEQVEALMAVAEQAASAVGISRLLLEQQHTIDQLDALYRQVSAQHALLRRSEDIHETLTTILLEDCSLHEITTALSELLWLPVVLQDEQLNVLSQAIVSGKDFAGISSREKDRNRGDPAVAEKIGRATKIERLMSDGSTSLLIATPVVAGDELCGYLSVPLGSSLEEDLLLRALEQAATVYALYMMKQRAACEAEGRIRGNLLADLLTGRASVEADAREWAHYLKLDFASGPYRVLTAKAQALRTTLEKGKRDVREIEQAKGRLEVLVRDFSSRYGPGAAAPIGDCVATLLTLQGSDYPNAVGERLVRLTHKEFPDLSVRIGISSACLRPWDLSKRYEETVALIDLAERLESSTRILCYDDWKAYGLIIRASHLEDLSIFARDALGPLLTQGDSSQLLSTLQAFIENGLNMTRTGEILYVHPNTVKYRLQKAADLLGVNLNDLDDVLAIKIALMVRRLNPDVLKT